MSPLLLIICAVVFLLVLASFVGRVFKRSARHDRPEDGIKTNFGRKL